MQTPIHTHAAESTSRKKLLVLVILIIAALTYAGFVLMIKSRQTEPPPKAYPAQPVSRLNSPKVLEEA